MALRYAPWPLLAASVLAAADGGRDWVPDAWSASFFKPQKVQLEGVGLVNDGSAFFATKTGVSALHDGMLTPLIEVREPEGSSLTAFHLCHHRNSIFYEVLASEGGALSIYEYSLAMKQRVLVREFQDGSAPASALACVDQYLLRSCPRQLLAVSLQGRWEQVLTKFDVWPEGSDSYSSVAVGFAADVVERAHVYAVAAHNRTLLRLHISSQNGPLQMSSEVVVAAGDGADAALGSATARKPKLAAWARGVVLFTDGCALRQVEVEQGRVRTLVGVPDHCSSAEAGDDEERLEPAPWASRLSRPVALAAPAEATAGGAAALLLTGAEVVHVDVQPSTCTGVVAGQCPGTSGCGWAQGPGNLGVCLDCASLTSWAASVRPEPLEVCGLEEAPRADTSYALGGCGCAQISTPQPHDPGAGDEGMTTGQVFFCFILVVAAVVVVLCLYRSSRRAQVMREIYQEDTAQFHVFTDDEGLH